MICKANDPSINADTNLVVLISGTPGLGKTTLACSAEKPFVIDVDHGMKRVSASHRADFSDSKSYTEILADVEEAAKLGYQTLVIDTVGALLDSISAHIIKDNPKNAQPDGTLTLKAYGVLKNVFLTFSANVRAKFKNTIFIFHENAARDGDNIFYDIIASGSAKQLVWQPVDLGAHMFVQGNKRYLGFTPTESYNAKSSFGIKGIIEIPDLATGAKNDFLTRLFIKVRDNIVKEAAELAPKNEAYDKVMAEGKALIEALNTPEDVPAILDAIGKLQHSLTSNAELKAMLKSKMTELKIVYDKTSKSYKYAE